MARSWRDYASASKRDNCDNSDKRADLEPPAGAFVPIVPFVTDLPALVREGLVALSTAPAPRLIRPELWPGVVKDALRLASDGWALSAINLGWSPLDLFGAVPDKHGDPEADGLAVRLGGRRVLAICGTFATVTDGERRSFLHRGNNAGAWLVWDLGRARG